MANKPNGEFTRFFQALPRVWQKGFICAMEGGAFRGDFEPKKDGIKGVAVFFVNEELADEIEEAIKDIYAKFGG